MDKVLAQYHKLKEKHPEAVLWFATDGWFEVYHEDAEACGRVLGIGVTYEDGIATAGFAPCMLDTYLPKMIRAGFRIAICDDLGLKAK